MLNFIKDTIAVLSIFAGGYAFLVIGYGVTG